MGAGWGGGDGGQAEHRACDVGESGERRLRSAAGDGAGGDAPGEGWVRREGTALRGAGRQGAMMGVRSERVPGIPGHRTADIPAVLGPVSFRLCPAHGSQRIPALQALLLRDTQPPGTWFPNGAAEQHEGALPGCESRGQQRGRQSPTGLGQEALSRRDGVG